MDQNLGTEARGTEARVYGPRMSKSPTELKQVKKKKIICHRIKRSFIFSFFFKHNKIFVHGWLNTLSNLMFNLRLVILPC